MKISGDRFDSRRSHPARPSAAVRVQPETFERLRLLVQNPQCAHRESAGFLLGNKVLAPDRTRKRFQTIFTVDGFVPASEECVCTPNFEYSKQNAAALRRQLREYSGTRDVVGFFRSNLRPGASVSGDDVNLISDQFGGDAVLLLIDLGQEDLPGTFYTFDPGKPALALATRRVRFGEDAAYWDGEAAEPDNWALPDEGDEGRVPYRPRASPIGFLPRAGDLAKWALAAIGIIVIVIFGFAEYRTMRLLEGQRIASAPTTALDLRAERAGGDNQWSLSWNQASAAIRSASRARLSVRDGYSTKEFDISLAELHTGRVLYSPTADDVSFRLEIFDLERGKSTSEAIRVLANAWPGNQLYGSGFPLSGRSAASDRVRSSATGKSRSADEPGSESADPADTSNPAAQPAGSPLRRFTPPAYRQPIIVSRTVDDLPAVPVPRPAAASGAGAGALILPPSPSPPPAASEGSRQRQTEEVAAAVAADPPRRVSSGMQEARLLRRVEPRFPSGASRLGLKGSVVVEGTIGVDGRLHDLRVISGNPILSGAAIEAIKEWRYSPAVLNGRTVTSPTRIEVKFNGGTSPER